MAGKFNAKFFNGEVFQKYIDRIPNPRKTELLKSRAIRSRRAGLLHARQK